MHPRLRARRRAPRRWDRRGAPRRPGVHRAIARRPLRLRSGSDAKPERLPVASEELGDPRIVVDQAQSAPGGSFLVRGRYPSAPPRAAIRSNRPSLVASGGTLRARRADDGTISLTVTLPFDRYLEASPRPPPGRRRGAGRPGDRGGSYALATTGWSGDEGDAGLADLCHDLLPGLPGCPVPPDPTHRRWIRAVRRTDGEALLDGGDPATTVYFHVQRADVPRTRTSSAAHRSPTSGPSSSVMTAPPPRRDGRFGSLRRPHRVPARRRAMVRTVDSARATTSDGILTLHGGGATRSPDAEDLRDAVNVWAPCLRPRRFPTEERIAAPADVPSTLLLSCDRRPDLVVTGRGWGPCFAAMVQSAGPIEGSPGMVRSGDLSFYYGGLQRDPT